VKRRAFLGTAAGGLLAGAGYAAGRVPLSTVKDLPRGAADDPIATSDPAGVGSLADRADDPVATAAKTATAAAATFRGAGVVGAAVFNGGKRPYRAGLDLALAAATGGQTRDPWASIFQPGDRISVKLNCLAGPGLSPRPELVDAIVAGIVSAGVPESAIVLFDRSSRELERAGYPIRKEDRGLRCFGTDALKGGGYGSEILEHRSIGSLFTRILTDHATVLVNVGVCKDHDLSGVSAGCKNLYGLIHNPNRYHANQCDPFLADLLDHPAVRPKLRLTIIDAIEAQCHGGPARSPAYTFRPNRVLVAVDPVATDAIAWELIETERARRGLPSLAEDKREPTWIAAAERLGLGVAERGRIDLREVTA
jgi:uncharacterized protein (DUF362 family)